MSQDNKFDNAFQERIKDLDFEFKEAYWDEMEALMDKRTKKRGALLWWISGVSLASLLLAGTFFFTTQNNKAGSKIAQIDKVQEFENSDDTPDNNESKFSEQDKTASELYEQNDTSSSDNRPIENVAQHKQNTISESSKNASAPKANPSKSPENNSITNNNRDNLVTSNNSVKTSRSSKSSTQAISENELPKITDELRTLYPKFAQSLEIEHAPLAEMPSESIHLRTWDSHVAILVGANHGQSLKTDEGTVGGLGTHWGLRFYFAHKKGFQLNTGLSFGVNSIRGLAYEETRKVFGFTQYDLVNTIQYNSMLTANIPLYMGYESYKFSVAGGLRLNYIMNTRGVVHTWDNSVVDQNVWGYAHGIKYFNLACGIESSYRIARRWDLGISFDMDLSSRSEENNDLISPEARLWQAGFFIKYRLN